MSNVKTSLPKGMAHSTVFFMRCENKTRQWLWIAGTVYISVYLLLIMVLISLKTGQLARFYLSSQEKWKVL